MSGAKRVKVVHFGEVTVPAPKLSKTHVAEQARRSGEALAAALQEIAKPGIRIRARKGVPMFRADASNPRFLIRELDGVEERGMMVGDRFVVG